MPQTITRNTIDEVLDLLTAAHFAATPEAAAAWLSDAYPARQIAEDLLEKAEVMRTAQFRALAERAIAGDRLPTVVDEPDGAGMPVLFGRRWAIFRVDTPIGPIRVGARWRASHLTWENGDTVTADDFMIEPDAWRRSGEDAGYGAAVSCLNLIRVEAQALSVLLQEERAAGRDTGVLDRKVVSLLVEKALRLDF